MKKLLVFVLVVYLVFHFGCHKSVTSAPPCHCVSCTCIKCECKPCDSNGCYPCKCPGCKNSVKVGDKDAGDYVGGPSHDNRDVTCDLPEAEHLKNKGGSDGAGLCVFTSIDHAARWQSVNPLIGFRDFMTKYPGGGYPEKVDTMIKKKAGAQAVEYVQFTDGDVGKLELALRTGRMPCITYGYSPRYGQKIAHMVNLVYLDDRWACVLDNNFPGINEYEWVERKEFVRRWNLGQTGWGVVLLDPPPPPVPHN